MIDLSPEAARLVKSMHEKIHELMIENHYLRSQLLSRDTTINLEGLVYPSERHGTVEPDPKELEVPFVEIEDMSGPFLGLDMDDLESGESECEFGQAARMVFGGVL